MPSTPPPGNQDAALPSPGLLGLGFLANFFDALGIGSFATTTAAIKLGRLTDDGNIPGTLNVGHALPTILQGALFLAIIEVDRLTMALMVAAAVGGAWFGAGRVARWPRRAIQRGMAAALLITAAIITLRQLDVFPSGGEATGLGGIALLLAVAASAVIGSLIALGIGNYAPTMAVTYLLGMSPRAVFPIMAVSGGLMLAVAAMRFVCAGRFDRRIALGLALGGIPGVLVAVYLVKSLDVTLLLWLVVGVLLYTAAMLHRSSRTPEVVPA
ncbi:MAG: permease [Gemmatimonadales bacterium]